MEQEHSFVVAGIQLTILGVWVSLESNDIVWPTVGFISVVTGTYLVGRVVAKPVWRSVKE